MPLSLRSSLFFNHRLYVFYVLQMYDPLGTMLYCDKEGLFYHPFSVVSVNSSLIPFLRSDAFKTD
jgi:hypothetical protein